MHATDLGEIPFTWRKKGLQRSPDLIESIIALSGMGPQIEVCYLSSTEQLLVRAKGWGYKSLKLQNTFSSAISNNYFFN